MLNLKEIREPIKDNLDYFQTYFKKSVKSNVPLLNIITSYILKNKGKQMRPMFVIFSAALAGGINDKTYRAAAMIELLHTASLVHDDVVDESDRRRGLFSVNALWKNKAAVLVGDFLLSKGMLQSLENKDYDMLQIVSDAIKKIIEGELLQMEKTRGLNIDEDVYFEIIRCKTASLFAACCACGAASANASDEFIQKMYSFGEAIGSSFAAAWEGLFGSLEYEAVMASERGTEITIDWQNGDDSVHSAADVWKMVFDSNQPWMLSSNGTIFTYEKEAIIPGLLKRWYAERKEMQAKLKECKNVEDEEYWDKRQLVKKINLNSLYGAILNPGCRFFDKRIGQSTTLTGRAIARHMDAYVNECITGKYDHVGEAIIYGDTDSCYFTAYPVLKDEIDAGKMAWSKEIAVQLYNSIADQVNISFPGFMEQAFHVPREMGEVIKGGREIVASKGLFITKKRYAVLYYDKENKRVDTHGSPGKVKAMGLDLKRSDTPKVIQEFLSTILDDVLTGATREQVIEKIREFKYLFKERPGWEKGSPKRVNNLTKYGKEEERLGKANMPGHVRAAMNWNNLRRMNSDKYSLQIVDGMKTIVCKLKANPLGWTSIGYPTDETHLPQWFKELPFNDTEMEATVVDQKLDNLLSVLEWDLASATNTENTFQTLFEW